MGTYASLGGEFMQGPSSCLFVLTAGNTLFGEVNGGDYPLVEV